jgi:hypothetical protein
MKIKGQSNLTQKIYLKLFYNQTLKRERKGEDFQGFKVNKQIAYRGDSTNS